MNLTPPVFKLCNVTVKFGQLCALTEVNLQINSGERVALVGPSGAGKSTLLRLLNGSLVADKGEVQVFGFNLASVSSEKRREIQRDIGVVHQQYHLVNNLRVIHNVNIGHLGRWSFLKAAFSLLWPLETKIAARALEKVGIPEKLHVRTDRLSGGELQRVALARVLVQDPKVILADEPISSLDPEYRREIMNLLHSLSTDSGKTLVASLHMMEYAYTYFHRIIGIKTGRVLFDVSVPDITQQMIDGLYRIDGTFGTVSGGGLISGQD